MELELERHVAREEYERTLNATLQQPISQSTEANSMTGQASSSRNTEIPTSLQSENINESLDVVRTGIVQQVFQQYQQAGHNNAAHALMMRQLTAGAPPYPAPMSSRGTIHNFSARTPSVTFARTPSVTSEFMNFEEDASQEESETQ